MSGVGSERGERERSAFRLIAALAWGVFRLTIRTVLWFGLLSGGASNNIIHTDMYGQIDIDPYTPIFCITLQEGAVLLCSNCCGAGVKIALQDPDGSATFSLSATMRADY